MVNSVSEEQNLMVGEAGKLFDGGLPLSILNASSLFELFFLKHALPL